MAWHSGKPADSDFLSASVQHIRENFAELEPLHPHVAELVDLTALQPHVTELVDLTTLHPHIAAILDSRIVEMGSNANGAYVCWENGLQVCWKRLGESDFPTTDQTATVQGLTYLFRTYTWTFPKPFAVVPIVFASGDVSGAAPENHTAFTSSTTTAQYEAGTLRNSWTYQTGNVLAIGLWK